jgi:hypothetical protein
MKPRKEILSSPCRKWTFVEIVDWFETEGSVFVTREEGEEARIRVVVSSQGEDEVIRSIWEYLRKLGFHPSFRPTRYILKAGLKRKRAAECELLGNLEQDCFLEHALPFLRTKKRRKEVVAALSWLRERRRLPNRKFKPFTCPEGMKETAEGDDSPTA